MAYEKTLSIYTDGAARGNPGEAGAGIIVRDGHTIILEKAQYLGHTTNNIAEYCAFILGLKEAEHLGASDITLYTDSQLLEKQIKGEYRVKDEKLKPLHGKAKEYLQKFMRYKLCHIRRNENMDADRLANQAIDRRSPDNADTTIEVLLASL